MGDGVIGHKKRRNDTHYSPSEYHQRYKKHNNMGQRDDWRSGGNFRDKDRYSEQQDRNRGGNQYRDPSEALWDVEINLIGQMDPNPMVHVCDTCRLPIRSYGRLIPCKHVFCFKCAKKTDKNCPRCGDEVHRIEQCRHGTVWMCSVTSCSRTYLSQRDLQAHISHRHGKPPPPPMTVPPPHLPSAILVPPPPVSSMPPPQVAPYVLMQTTNTSRPPPTILPPPTVLTSPSTQEMMAARPSSNLITIQIQDNQQPASYGSAPTSSGLEMSRLSTSVSGQWPPHSSSRPQNRSNY